MKRYLLLLPAALVLASCSADDMDYFWNGPRDGSYSPAYNSSSDQAQWNRMKQQAEYQQQSQAYKSGFTTTPPPGHSAY